MKNELFSIRYCRTAIGPKFMLFLELFFKNYRVLEIVFVCNIFDKHYLFHEYLSFILNILFMLRSSNKHTNTIFKYIKKYSFIKKFSTKY